jgi:DNA-binding transcriptional regulator YhcF (GntR family)
MGNNFRELRVPNGPTLTYKLPKDMGSQTKWFRTRFYDKQLENTAKLKKNRLPILGLQNMVCLDYDQKDYPTGWTADRLKNALEYNLPYALVTTSVSGNVKAFVVLDAAVPSDVDALLKELLPPNLHFYDKAGATRCYVNQTLVSELGDWLASNPPPVKVGPDQEREEGRTILNIDGKTRGYQYHEAPLSALPEELRLWAKTPERLHLLRILSATWGLLERFNLPLELIANQVGVTPITISRFFKELKQLGVLECIDHSYQWGVKAKTYKAHGSLYKAIQKHKAGYKTSKPLISAVRPGMFYKDMLSALNRFDTEDAFIRWVSRLPGVTEKRRREASKYARCHFRKKAA